MTDDALVRVELPRTFVEELRYEKAKRAKYLRKSAAVTETNAPQTKRNATAIAKWREEAAALDQIADQCFYALRDHPEVTEP